jgi:hypothetical protein
MTGPSANGDSFRRLEVITGVGRRRRSRRHTPHSSPRRTTRMRAIYYEVGTGPLTAGKFTAALVKNVDAYRAYPPSERAFA